MKRACAVFLSLVLVCGCLAGCSQKKGNDITVESIISHLKQSGIPITYEIVYTNDNDPNGNKDHAYLQKGNFSDERIEVEYEEAEPKSGTIEIFNDIDEVKERADYINQISVLDTYKYQVITDNILLRLNSAFTEEQVSEYSAAIDGDIYHSPSQEDHKFAYCYGQPFIIHAKQLADGMTLDEAISIMGFDPQEKLSTCFWFDELSTNSVYVNHENDGTISRVNISIASEETDKSTSTPNSEAQSEQNNSSSESLSSQEAPVSSKKPITSSQASNEVTSKAPQTPIAPSGGTASQRNAISKAKSYLRFSAFSYEGLIGQLEFEGFSHEDAIFGADNCGANWDEQAIKKAKSYLDFSAFSYKGLIGQLEYEKFTHAQAVYGTDNCGADWNEQAVKKAESYLKYSSFSRESLISQLEFDGFTHDQAVYGVTSTGL